MKNELTRNSSGNIRPQSSQLAEPLWTDPGVNSGISLCELISTKKKKVQAGNEWSNIVPKDSQAKKKPPIIRVTHPIVQVFVLTFSPRVVNATSEEDVFAGLCVPFQEDNSSLEVLFLRCCRQQNTLVHSFQLIDILGLGV